MPLTNWWSSELLQPNFSCKYESITKIKLIEVKGNTWIYFYFFFCWGKQYKPELKSYPRWLGPFHAHQLAHQKMYYQNLNTAQHKTMKNQSNQHCKIKFKFKQWEFQLPVSSSMTSILVALYRGQSAEPIFNAAQGLVTVDFLDVACRLLLNPTRYTESPRRNAGSASDSSLVY